MVIALKKVEEEKEKDEVKVKNVEPEEEEEKNAEIEEKMNESMEANENDFVNDLVRLNKIKKIKFIFVGCQKCCNS